MEYDILTADVPNKNGRVYPTEELQKAVEKFNKEVEGRPRLCELRKGLSDATEFSTVNLEQVSHQIHSVRLEDGKLIADITPVGPKKNYVEEFAGNGYVFRPNGFADIDENGVISNYRLVSVSLLHESDAA